MDADRFPKPDVPWFHELYGAGWDTSSVIPQTAYFGEWECSLERADSRATCAKSTPDRSPGPPLYCRLVPGHDGPHFAVHPDCEQPGPVIVTSLRRVARAEVA